MCIIAICEKGKSLDDETFGICFKGNHNGAGFAWHRDGQLWFKKGFMKEEAALEYYQKIKSFPHVAHFRLISSGTICPELTHPFIISNTSPIMLSGKGKIKVLFHNGTISNWKSLLLAMNIATGKKPEGKLSDSRTMAMVVSRTGDEILHDDGGKFVIASKDKFVYWGAWEKENGILFSNSGYKKYAFNTADWLRELRNDREKLPKELSGHASLYDKYLAQQYCEF